MLLPTGFIKYKNKFTIKRAIIRKIDKYRKNDDPCGLTERESVLEGAFDIKPFPEFTKLLSEEKGIESLDNDLTEDIVSDVEGIFNNLLFDEFLDVNKGAVFSLIVLYNPSVDGRGDDDVNSLFELVFILLERLSLKSVIDIIVYNYRL